MQNSQSFLKSLNAHMWILHILYKQLHYSSWFHLLFFFFKLCESYTFYLKLLQRCHNFYTIVCQVFAWLFFWSGYWRWISLNHFLFSYVAQVVDIQGKFLMHFVNKSPCTFFYGYLSSSFIKSQCVSLKCFLLYYLCTFAEFFFLMIVL